MEIGLPRCASVCSARCSSCLHRYTGCCARCFSTASLSGGCSGRTRRAPAPRRVSRTSSEKAARGCVRQTEEGPAPAARHRTGLQRGAAGPIAAGTRSRSAAPARIPYLRRAPLLKGACRMPRRRFGRQFQGLRRPPAKPGACVSPGRAACRQASQGALNTLSPASLAPPRVNGVLPAACCIF